MEGLNYFYSYRRHLRRVFPKVPRIRKITLDGGFSCPNLDGTKGRGGCVYCNNKSFSPVLTRGNASTIPGQIRKASGYFRDRFNTERYIAYFQPYSNTYAPVEKLETLYRSALEQPGVMGLAIGTRPDCLNPRIIQLLEDIAKDTYVSLEIGMQTKFDETLKAINRRHTYADFVKGMDMSVGRNFEVCVHVMIGLPGETNWHVRQSAEALQQWKYQSIKIHPLHVVRGTRLARDFKERKYIPLTLEEYVESLVDFLERIPHEVAVQRFTGDAPPHLLLGPHWCRDKLEIQRRMIATFRQRGSTQGSLYFNPTDVPEKVTVPEPE